MMKKFLLAIIIFLISYLLTKHLLFNSLVGNYDVNIESIDSDDKIFFSDESEYNFRLAWKTTFVNNCQVEISLCECVGDIAFKEVATSEILKVPKDWASEPWNRIINRCNELGSS
jgi:hypothetical protein